MLTRAQMLQLADYLDNATTEQLECILQDIELELQAREEYPEDHF